MKDPLPPANPEQVPELLRHVGQTVHEILNRSTQPPPWGFFIMVVQCNVDNPMLETMFNISEENAVSMLKEAVARLEGRLMEHGGEA